MSALSTLFVILAILSCLMVAVDSRKTPPSRTDLYLHSHAIQQQYETPPWTQLAGALGCGGIVCKPGWNLRPYSSSTILSNIHLKVKTKQVRDICGTLATPSETLNKFLLVIAPGRINVCTFNTFCHIGL
jgi:hypothetical protein